MVELEDIRFSVVDHKRQLEFNLAAPEPEKKPENGSRPFLRKGAGLTRFYKDKQPEQVQILKSKINNSNKKKAAQLQQQQQQKLSSKDLSQPLSLPVDLISSNYHSRLATNVTNAFQNRQRPLLSSFNRKPPLPQQQMKQTQRPQNSVREGSSGSSKSNNTRLSTSPVNPQHDNNSRYVSNIKLRELSASEHQIEDDSNEEEEQESEEEFENHNESNADEELEGEENGDEHEEEGDHHDEDDDDDEEEENDDDELKIFEALEEAAGAGSFCSTSSLAAHFLKTKLNAMKNNKGKNAGERDGGSRQIQIQKQQQSHKQLVNSPARSKENPYSLNRINPNNHHPYSNVNESPHHDTSDIIIYTPTSSLFDSDDEIQTNDDEEEEEYGEEKTEVGDEEDGEVVQDKSSKNDILHQAQRQQQLNELRQDKGQAQVSSQPAFSTLMSSSSHSKSHTSSLEVGTSNPISNSMQSSSHHNHHHHQPSHNNNPNPFQFSPPSISANALDALEKENVQLKARLFYIEEKMEKNTLEWWSHKEQMVEIIHGLQSHIARKDTQLESIQSSFAQKIKQLQEDLQAKSRKWCESQVKMVERVQGLEEELEIAQTQVEKVKNRMQKVIEGLQRELREKNAECAKNHEILLQRIKSLENAKTSANTNTNNTPKGILSKGPAKQKQQLSKPTEKKAPEPTKPQEETIKESITSLEENIFGDDCEDGEVGVTKILPNGDQETLYSNGTRKIIARDFSEMKHLYTNGDIRTVKRDGTVKYFYGESGTWHTTYTNGVEYYEFANGQTERRNPNGVIEVVYANGCVKYSHPSGTEECIFADNTILRVDTNGERAVVLPNGQQEIHGLDYKKRIYPDGTAKIVYNDGSQETRYPNGRIRIKSAEGVLVADMPNPNANGSKSTTSSSSSSSNNNTGSKKLSVSPSLNSTS